MVRQQLGQSGLGVSGKNIQSLYARGLQRIQQLRKRHHENHAQLAHPESNGVMPISDGVSEHITVPPPEPIAAEPISEPLTEEPPTEGRSPEPPKRKPPKFRGRWGWSLLCLAVLGVLSGMGSAALLWLVSLPPPPECEDPASLTLDMEQLYCAQQAIQSGGLPELIAGLKLLKQWTPDDPLYAETQNLAEEWSKQVLAIARTKVSQSDLNGALDAISHIPNTTPVYEEAQQAVAYWKEQWAEGEAIYAKAQDAFKTQNWTLASEQISAMAKLSNPYWNSKRANELAQQLGVERRARQIFIQAQKIAEGGSPEQLGTAITKAHEVTEGTFAWQDARTHFKQWSQTLISLGSQKWQAGDAAGAIAIFQTTPKASPVPELQDLIRFSNAYKLASDATPTATPSSSWTPSLQHVWKLMEAIAAVKQVPADSPFFTQAQATKTGLEAQLRDLIQLNYANLTAKLGQHSTYELAIGQAQQISPDRPRRIQAQTLIAYWQDRVETLEDQPYLDYAIELAKSGTIEDLRAAIAEASQIQQGRALRGDAQTWIAAWRRDIERIEDQPYLDRAWILADEGKLSEAIEAAQAILPGRALYGEAQSAISEWQAQIVWNNQVAADRPILDRARRLADQGNLWEAIRVASEIGSGRALSREAQSAIAEWRYQLNPPPQYSEPGESGDEFLQKEEKTGNSPEEGAPFNSPIEQFPFNQTPSPQPGNQPTPIPFNQQPLPLDQGLPDRIETVPPPTPTVIPDISPPELLPPVESPSSIEVLPPPLPPESAPAEPPPAPQSSYDGYYDERYYESY